MKTIRNLIAIGRSRYLYDSIRYLAEKGYVFKAIITEEAYDEYDVKHGDFERMALDLGAAFFMRKSLVHDEILNIIRENDIRVAISANWKYTLPEYVLDLFKYGILNYHLGNLPDYKGNATVNWTMLNGEPYIFGNIHKMDLVLDAGDIIARRKILIGHDMYIGEILRQAEADVPSLFEEALLRLETDPDSFAERGSAEGLRCYPRLPEDSQVDWRLPAIQVAMLVRASSQPYGGAYSFLNGKKVIIWKATVHIPGSSFLAIPGHVVAVQKDKMTIRVACSDGMLEIEEIEIDGEKMRPVKYINSIRMRFKFKENA